MKHKIWRRIEKVWNNFRIVGLTLFLIHCVIFPKVLLRIL